VKRLIALMLAIAAAGLSATPAAAQLADTWHTISAGFQWDMTRPALNSSTAAIAALGIIGGGALLDNSARRIRCYDLHAEYQIEQPDGSWLTATGEEVHAQTGILVTRAYPYPQGFITNYRDSQSCYSNAGSAHYARGGLLAGFSGGYLIAKFLPWPGSPSDKFSNAPEWAASSIAALGLIGSAWIIYEIAEFDECNRRFLEEHFTAWRSPYRTRSTAHRQCTDKAKGTAQLYAAGGLLAGISGGYLLATLLPRFQLPWPVAPVADTDTRTGTPLFGFSFTHPNRRHRIELKTDAAAETTTLHYRWRW